MVVLIAGASHTGKTVLAQKLLKTYGFPYLSADHLKMGLIRSGYTDLTPEDDAALSAYLWPVLREIVKTAVENGQNLVIEGNTIPFDWEKDFDGRYLPHIRYDCLIMPEDYIRAHYRDILTHAHAIETRKEPSPEMEELIRDNRENLMLCKRYGCRYLLTGHGYDANLTL